MLSVYDHENEHFINWKVDELPNAYYVKFDLAESIRHLYPQLNHQSANPKKCCEVKIHGYDQPDLSQDLYILVKGRGMGQFYRFPLFNFTLTDSSFTGVGTAGPHPFDPIFNCKGEGHNWQGYFIYTYEFLNFANFVNFKNMDARFALGHASEPSGRFNTVICEDNKKISYGTFEFD